jgi:hypothetical protein
MPWVSALKLVDAYGAKCKFEDLLYTMPKPPTSTKLFLSKLSVTCPFAQVVATKVLYVAPNDPVYILM